MRLSWGGPHRNNVAADSQPPHHCGALSPLPSGLLQLGKDPLHDCRCPHAKGSIQRLTPLPVSSGLDLSLPSYTVPIDPHPRVEHTGESYLVVSGHDGTPDHLRRMLAMASDMLAAVQVRHVY